ncbi:hypothetical protein D3C78_1988740 [compost metagenome]
MIVAVALPERNRVHDVRQGFTTHRFDVAQEERVELLVDDILVIKGPLVPLAGAVGFPHRDFFRPVV